MKFILASTSPYRKAQLNKLGIAFECIRPSLDEEALKQQLLANNTPALKVAEELSLQKGLSVLKSLSTSEDTLILSGDQLVHFNGEILGKAPSLELSLKQLQKLQNNIHELITAVTLIHKAKPIQHTEVIKLKMHQLSEEEILNYIQKDQAFDCAGSYKIEQSGIALFEKIEAQDFSAIEGLPMLWLSQKLKEMKYEFFKH